MDEQLQQEAMELHHKLYRAMLAENSKVNSVGRYTGDQARIDRLYRLSCLAADRWRRRCGYTWRRVPAGVRGSRGMVQS